MRRTAILVLLLALWPAAAQAQIPTIDVRDTCRIAASAMVQLLGGSTAGNDTEICLGSEQRSHDQIVKDWSTYSAQDAGRCIRTDVYLPSYVEWLTCLEMERDVRTLNLGLQLVDPSGTMTMPRVRLRPLW